MLNKHSTHTNLLVLLIFGLTAIVIQAAPARQATLTSPLPTPGQFDSPLPKPALCPSTTNWATLGMEVKIVGLDEKHRAALQLRADTSQTAACLSQRKTEFSQLDVHNGSRKITFTEIPDGFYKLTLEAPTHYLRDPGGYLFQVQEGQIVRRPDFVFEFRLVSPSEQTLPSCREFEKAFEASSSEAEPMRDAIPVDTQRDACRAEGFIDISAPPKQPERPREMGTLSEDYHYVGPMTYQDNQGVWGRNRVVDPNVPHPGPAGNRFVVERVYANDTTWDRWIEAGWGEVSWRDDRQYIYEYDSVNETWNFFDEFTLSSGSKVETRVYYVPNLNQWRAYYLYEEYPYSALLASESLGFTTADHGFNRGEIFTADGVHPILPISHFDMGYLRLNDTWETWDSRYSAQTRMDADPPYQINVISQFHQFDIHSPIVFIPLVLKDVQ
jgi:hypothetical protein